MSHQPSPEDCGQSPGCDPKTKRNSGLFAFLKWFKPSTSRESIDTENSSSCDSLNSTHSNGTVASFSFIPPSAYQNKVAEKCLVLGPETDTYKARLKQRDKRRENDKNVTLRKKYNLFFQRETILKTTLSNKDDENTKSLPLMTRTMEEEKTHRRTNSESSKTKKAGAYLHVKGKRKAPQPPNAQQSGSTLSLRRKKRLAPHPPIDNKININSDVIFNDSLKLDHGVLKPTKDDQLASSARSSIILDAPVSPRPWYKRNNKPNRDSSTSNKYEPIECLPDVQFMRNSTIDLTIEETPVKITKKDEKRKSGMSFLTNISELDREAFEIVKKEQQKNGFAEVGEMPQFMRPKDEPKSTDSWISPKRRSAKDLIAKFNAITNVTKVTVNSAFFGSSQAQSSSKNYFGKERKQEHLLESHKKRIEEIDRKLNNPLMKSESASAIKAKPETPKGERKSWNCPKCSLQNEYWRIICVVCSAIKPYFDDFSIPGVAAVKNENNGPSISPEKVLERSKTQIGFSALASYNMNKNKQKIEKSISLDEKNSKPEEENKNEEREKLKKMLIEMKNSLPKRKSNILLKQTSNNRASVIVENPENDTQEEETKIKEKTEYKKTVEEKAVEITIGTQETIYENIKVKKTDRPKPIKVSSSVQTSGAVKKTDQRKSFQDDTKTPNLNLSTASTKNFQEETKIPPSTQPNKSFHQEQEDVKKNVVNISTPPSKGPQEKCNNDVKKESSKQEIDTKKVTVKKEELLKKPSFELMRPKDFEIIYSDTNSESSAARIYANLARNDELSLFFNMPKNFNDMKNNFAQADVNTDTIEVNRLLRRLESAIAKGEMTEAAVFAKELAQLKVNCSVIRQKPASSAKKQGFNIEIYVEDKISHRGPFSLEVTETQTVAELKRQVEQEFEIPVNVQRWILGKELATDDEATLKDHKITTERCPVFLYLVAPDSKTNSVVVRKSDESPSTSKFNQDNELKKSESGEKNNDRIPKIIEVIPKVAEPIPKIEAGPSSERNLIHNKAGDVKSQVQNDIGLSKKSLVDFKEVKINNVETYKSVILPALNKTAKDTPTAKSEIVPKAKIEEDFEDYDNTKTLKPLKEWECHLCTLLNPISSNICAVCATAREKESSPAPVAPVKKSLKKKAPQPLAERKDQTCYLQLVNLDNTDLVLNSEPFECVVCFLEIKPGDGVTLRECLHQFCKLCLAHTIEYTEDAEVKCPYRDDQYSCNIALQDREIKALVTPQVYENYLAKSVAEAENKIGKSFHCKTPDCKGWCIFEDNVNEFRCPVCRRVNCLTCQAIHSGMNCKQYQEKMTQESEVDEDARRTKEMVDEMVKKGEALTCPTCQVILMKKWGCDWVRCSMCKTEICWVTRGPRWGPGGKGDTSGGCQCGVNGVKCHPQCSYCH